MALTGCRRTGSLPPSYHSLLCARASAPVVERKQPESTRNFILIAAGCRKLCNDSLLAGTASCAGCSQCLAGDWIADTYPPDRPAAPCGFYPALHDWPRSQHRSVMWRRHRPFCGSAKLATVAPWLPLTNRSDGVYRITHHLTISTTMRVCPRALVDGERSALRRRGR